MFDEKQKIYLAGIGPGSPDSMTEEVRKCMWDAECLIGAGRMLACAARILGGKEDPDSGVITVPGKVLLEEYRPVQIADYIKLHSEFRKITVLLSGDTGFYSGARGLAAVLGSRSGQYEVTFLPGISAIVCLAARLKTSWEDAAIVSLHGTDADFIRTVHRNRKTFLLLGGRGTGENVYARLKEFGLDDVMIHIGKMISYPEEELISGKIQELSPEDFMGLCVVMIENPDPDPYIGPHLRDEVFIRGKVPMTKEDVRAVSVARMELTDHAVVYDVGAGTGSVSVEAALSGEGIRVYAIEKNPEAGELLEKNRKKFFADGIRVIRGSAPEALMDLEPPTHVFIGGSSGNLKEILRIVLTKNPEVRIVINTISLETLKEVMEAAEEGLLAEPGITQLCVAKGKELGRYHMMMGQNPVYIISAGGRE